MKKTLRQPSANRIARRLIEWFAENARDVPWRRTLDPYAIWVSEIMLQQTQVTTVIPYFDRWMETAPNVEALTQLSSTRLHKLWEGLGYYTRARNLQKAASRIITEHEGTFPTDYDSILQLSGIGRYTAGAITSIAFNQPQAIVDGNVIRVLSRLYGIEGDPKGKDVVEQFWGTAQMLVAAAGRLRSQKAHKNPELMFSGNCSMLNQALMELGATICTPKNPDCARCPLQQRCYANDHEAVSDFPQLPTRSKPTKRRFIAFIISYQNKFYVTQRPDGVVNAHLWELPNIEVEFQSVNPVDSALTRIGLRNVQVEHVNTVKHSITRYRMHTECYRVLGNQEPSRETGQLRTKEQLKKLPFTSAHRRFIEFI